MAKAEATVEELVGMIERGELRLPEMQRRYVWRSPRVRDRAAQCIPTEENILSLEAYKGFLVERRMQVAARLNEFLLGDLMGVDKDTEIFEETGDGEV